MHGGWQCPWGGCGKGQRGAGAPQRFWAWLNTAGAQQLRVVLGDLRGLFHPKRFDVFAAAWLPHITEAGAGCGARCSFLPQMGIQDPSSEACLCRGQRAWVSAWRAQKAACSVPSHLRVTGTSRGEPGKTKKRWVRRGCWRGFLPQLCSDALTLCFWQEQELLCCAVLWWQCWGSDACFSS